jgi:hypothetical protein
LFQDSEVYVNPMYYNPIGRESIAITIFIFRIGKQRWSYSPLQFSAPIIWVDNECLKNGLKWGFVGHKNQTLYRF